MGTLTDLIRGEFAHLDPSAQLARIDQAEKDLALLSETDCARLLAAVGVETQNKKQGAEVVAAIRAVAEVATQIGLNLQ